MKKLFYLLFLLPLAFFASCSDDDDLPEVDFSITLSNVALENNTFYAIKGDTVKIDNGAVKSLTDKSATVTGVRYFLNGIPIFGTIENPFVCEIETENLSPATYTLNVTSTILQVDKSIASGVCNYPLVVVENADKLPAGSTIGTQTLTVTIQPKK